MVGMNVDWILARTGGTQGERGSVVCGMGCMGWQIVDPTAAGKRNVTSGIEQAGGMSEEV